MQVTKFIYKAALFATLATAIATTRSAYAEETNRYQVPAPLAVEQQSHAPIRVAQSCGWFVIVGCAKSRRGARRASSGARVLDTNDYPNFRNGWYCGFDGPFSRKSAAKQRRLGWLEASPDAYVKKGC